MSSLPTPLRRQLESACKQARNIAKDGARKALEALAVHEPDPYRHMSESQRDLRRKLRAQAKQLGDGESQTRHGAYEIKHLVEKLAYDQWHRLLFARFLMENNLLISPEHGVSVSLDDCEELAQSLGLKDAWAVAARFAAKELPEIFRADDPVGAVELPVEDRNPLIQLVTGLPVEVFTANDSLGWCYQFWQAERKDEVNAAGNKIGADELPAVTQLFTEDYMVDFLLDNTLGAWHAGKVLAAKPALVQTAQDEEELRNAVTLPGCPWRYLRFIKAAEGKWTPAAGTFDGWPKSASELKCLDPCMGSGHFVVAMFERLVALRVAEGALDEAVAVAAVICDNLFGLEIDPRCTQIAAFNLALAAWRRVGHCALPAMNLACSGLAPNAKQEDWLKLAGDDEKTRNGMERLYRLFKDAPVLGSLINPLRNSADSADMFVADYRELQPLFEKALTQESKDATAHEVAVTAYGLAKAAVILGSQFTLVATNVPFLTHIKFGGSLAEYIDRVFVEGRANLATAFVQRILALLATGQSAAFVSPQSWWFLRRYLPFRDLLLRSTSWNLVARLGEDAFQSPIGEVVGLTIASSETPQTIHEVPVLDVFAFRTADAKAVGLTADNVKYFSQLEQRKNAFSVVLFDGADHVGLLSDISTALAGCVTSESSHFIRKFWEIERLSSAWEAFQTTSQTTCLFGGMSDIILWQNETGELAALAASVSHLNHAAQNWQRGKPNWGKKGVVLSMMGKFPASLYTGEIYDSNCCAIIPVEEPRIAAVWAYCESEDFHRRVRRINQKRNVEVKTLLSVSFDFEHWQKVAAEKYPYGLPKPFSSDPTQWLFNGHPKGSDQPLHVAVARLLGYQWPRQTGSSFPDCPALDPDGLERLADDDGILCLSATKGEAPAAERLRAALVQALGKVDLGALFASAGSKGSKSEALEEWLRDEFFEQHCALFQHRPFTWHIWDGHKSGFSALVNYHKLTFGNMETLTYAYLGDWIRRQQTAVEAGESGSDARLQAAKQLQARLKLILEGEPPYDLFVRWKPLSKQAIGWHPDFNDGVRINIRPFATADILRKRVKIKWEKDRGKEPVRDKKEFPWFWGWDEKQPDFAGVGKEPDGNRWNDCHYTIECKKRAREADKPR
jgi:hypothetical protein